MAFERPHHSSDYLQTRYINRAGFGGKKVPIDSLIVKVGLIGLGRAGIIHLDNLRSIPRFQVRYIVDSCHFRLQKVKSNYCLDETTILLTDTQAGTIFSDDSISAVVIATPSGDHEKYIIPALKAGKHVLCEKPIAFDLEIIKQCYKLAKESNRILLCAFNRRYDPACAQVAEQVRAGTIGKVLSISSVARDNPKPTLEYLKISGGILHDCAVHDVDLLCNFIMKELPEKVFVAAHAFDPEIAALGDYDVLGITLKFPSGALGRIDISREATYGYDQRVEVLGKEGLLRSENQRPNAVMLSKVDGCTLNPIMHSFPSRYSEAYTRQLEHFLAAIDGTEEQRITGDNVIDVVRITEALEKSVKSGAFEDVIYEKK